MTDRHSNLGIHGLHAHAGARRVHRLALLKRSRRVALAGVLLLGGGLALVAAQRLAAARTLAESAATLGLRHVQVVSPQAASSERTLSLPGTLQGQAETVIYARSSGYLAAWYKDIGDSVKEGELLARIDTPEVAQQLLEARAAQAQAAATLSLATSTLARWEALRKLDSVSQQELEEKRNAHAQAQAAVASTGATVQRLQQQLQYSQVKAPFAGVITRRSVDVGNLIDAGGSARSLFVLTRSDPLRVYVQVPENNARQIKPGDAAEVRLQEWPGRVFKGEVVRSAKAIDTATRTLQLEIRLPNPQGELLPGAYAQIALKAVGSRSEPFWRVPSNTLLFRPEGPRVALVDDGGKVHLQPVTIRRELGVEVDVDSPLSATSRLVLNPADSLADGDAVQVAAAAGKAAQGR